MSNRNRYSGCSYLWGPNPDSIRRRNESATLGSGGRKTKWWCVIANGIMYLYKKYGLAQPILEIKLYRIEVSRLESNGGMFFGIRHRDRRWNFEFTGAKRQDHIAWLSALQHWQVNGPPKAGIPFLSPLEPEEFDCMVSYIHQESNRRRTQARKEGDPLRLLFPDENMNVHQELDGRPDVLQKWLHACYYRDIFKKGRRGDGVTTTTSEAASDAATACSCSS